jgi:hypothetical protein
VIPGAAEELALPVPLLAICSFSSVNQHSKDKTILEVYPILYMANYNT